MMTVKTFRPTDFIRGKNGSIALKEELQKYDMQELIKIYDTFTDPRYIKELSREMAIDKIASHAVSYCNRGMCLYNEEEKKWYVETPYK